MFLNYLCHFICAIIYKHFNFLFNNMSYLFKLKLKSQSTVCRAYFIMLCNTPKVQYQLDHKTFKLRFYLFKNFSKKIKLSKSYIKNYKTHKVTWAWINVTKLVSTLYTIKKFGHWRKFPQNNVQTWLFHTNNVWHCVTWCWRMFVGF